MKNLANNKKFFYLVDSLSFKVFSKLYFSRTVSQYRYGKSFDPIFLKKKILAKILFTLVH